MNKTGIEWTNLSANPLKYRDAAGKVVWGCVHASPGCQHCYAEALAHRYGRGGPFNVQTMSGLTPFLDDAELHKMLTSKRVDGLDVSGSMCFVGDMTDVFGPWVPDALLDRLFATFALRPDVVWQVLTKRAERARTYLQSRARSAEYWETAARAMGYSRHFQGVSYWQFPLHHVWIGVSVEDRDRLARIDHLKDTPAAVRFVSFEPLLQGLGALILDGIDWCIVGGESGAGARPCDVGWVRNIVSECRRQQSACFVKQLGAVVSCDGMEGGYGDGPSNMWPRETDRWEDSSMPGGFRRHLADYRKGGEMSEWPEDLRVRQWPIARDGSTRPTP